MVYLLECLKQWRMLQERLFSLKKYANYGEVQAYAITK